MAIVKDTATGVVHFLRESETHVGACGNTFGMAERPHDGESVTCKGCLRLNRVNPFTDRDVTVMFLSLQQLVDSVHPGTGIGVQHNHHACIHYRELSAKLESAPVVGA